MLDVGCGWGSFVIHAAANHGVQAVGITLSPAQAELARRRVAEAGLEDRVEIRVADYRDLGAAGEGYDAIASIGMVEHVGAAPDRPLRAPARRACSSPAAGCSTTASPACATARRRRDRSPSATCSRTRRRCTSRA